jgi:Flp pilus assembly protein TadD
LAAKLFSLLLREGRDAEAGSFGDGWMKRHPKDAKMDYLLSVRDITRGDLKAAETRLRRVLAAYPANALALNNLAWVLVKTSGKEAVDYARRAVDVQPDRPELMDTLALALAADKQFAAAMDVQKRALELAPNDPGLRLGVARIALLAGDKSLARTELEHLKTLGPSFVGQAEVSKLMQAL